MGFSPIDVLAREAREAGLLCAQRSSSELDLAFAPAGSSGGGRVRVHCSTDGSSFISVSASSDLRVPAPLRRRVAELLAAVNAGYARGGVFLLDLASGEVRCRASHGLCSRAGPDAAAARTLVDGAWKASLLDAATHYYVVERALALLLGDASLRTAFINHDTVAAMSAFILQEIGDL